MKDPRNPPMGKPPSNSPQSSLTRISRSLRDFLNTPLGVVFVTAVFIFSVEFLFMELLNTVFLQRFQLSDSAWGAIDALTIIVSLSPLLYFMVRNKEDNEEKYRSLFGHLSDGFAYCRIIVDENNKPVDFIYLEVNDSFERLTGCKREEVAGKRVTDIFPGIIKTHPELIETYGNVALNGVEARFELLFEPLGRWLTVKAYSPEKGCFIAIFDDVTERRNATEAIRGANEKYRSLFESFQDGIISADSSGVIVSWNNGAERIFGYSEEEVRNQEIAVLMPERFRSLHREGFGRVATGGDPHIIGKTVELTGLHKDGFEFPLELSVSQWQAADRHFFTAIVRDISERKKAEEQLRLRAKLLDSTTDSIFVHDQDWNLVYVNEAAWKTRGYTHEELMRINLHDLDLPEFAKLIKQRGRKLIETGQFVFESAHYCKDGSVMPIEVNSKAIESGGRILFLSTARDITERKKAEEKLRTLKNAVEQAVETILITDVDGNIEYANAAVYRETGYLPEELLGQNPRIFNSGKQDKLFYKKFWDTITSGKVWYGSLQNKKKSGELFEEEMTVAPVFDEKKRISHFVAIRRDVTHERRFRQQLIQTEKLATLGTFVSGVAHELNNPLTSVIGFSELLLEDKSLPNGVRKKLETIYAQSLRTVDIVRNLLSFSRKTTAEKKMIDINQTVERVLKLHAYRLKGDNVSVNFVPIQPPQLVCGVENELQQVFMNILINAHHEMLKQAKRVLAIRIEKKNDFICVSMENSGNPIPSSHFKQLFDPFFTTKPVGEGTGLGLYICHQIVTQHSGIIMAENIGTEGVRFSVCFPLSASEKELALTENERKGGIHDLRVLLIDDEPSVREYLAMFLTEENNFCMAIDSCEEAKGILEASDFDIIISDVKMPGMGGYEFGEWLSERKPEIMRRLILITGVFEKEAEEFARKHQSHILIKPIRKDELLTAIASTIRCSA